MLHLLLQIARVFALLSLASIGGANAVLPEIRRQVVIVQAWMSDASFANVFAISHAAPGPNIIMVSLVGWQLAGLAGLIVATLAVVVPSCTFAFVAGRVIARWSERRWTRLLREGLIPLALGLILASGLSMMRMADHDASTLIISLGTATFVIVSRRNPLWAIAAGAAANIVTPHFT